MTRKTDYNKYYIFIFLISLLTTFLLIISCNNTPNEPEKPEPGRRDYTWEIDTIRIPFTLLLRMWGNSPDDIWAVGPGGSMDQTIWHYDGEIWRTDSISRSIEPMSIYGFSNEEIWIAGVEGKIFKFTGSDWYRRLDFDTGYFGFYSFTDIWGETKRDVYAVGYADSLDKRLGFMFKYNGMAWERVKLPKNYITLQAIRKSRHYSNLFIQGRIQHQSQNDSSVIINYNGSGFKLLYKEIATRATIANIAKVGDDIFCSIGNSIYKIHTNELKLLMEVENSSKGIQIFGRGINDLFIRKSNSIAHYNGNDTQSLFMIDERLVLTDTEVLDQEIFILFRDYENGYNLVYHGY